MNKILLVMFVLLAGCSFAPSFVGTWTRNVDEGVTGTLVVSYEGTYTETDSNGCSYNGTWTDTNFQATLTIENATSQCGFYPNCNEVTFHWSANPDSSINEIGVHYICN